MHICTFMHICLEWRYYRVNHSFYLVELFTLINLNLSGCHNETFISILKCMLVYSCVYCTCTTSSVFLWAYIFTFSFFFLFCLSLRILYEYVVSILLSEVRRYHIFTDMIKYLTYIFPPGKIDQLGCHSDSNDYHFIVIKLTYSVLSSSLCWYWLNIFWRS